MPVTGGTLTALDGRTLLAADPATDRLWVVDVTSRLRPLRAIDLPRGSQPRRVAVGQDAWVALRGGVARVDPWSGKVDLFPVCPEARGVAVDGGAVWVACADGDLVQLSPEGQERARQTLDDDLRDVVIVGGVPWVSRFRSAEVLVVEPGGVRRLQPPTRADAHPAAAFEPAVAWRMVADPLGGGVLLAHQRAQPGVVHIGEGSAFGAPAYGGPGCDAVVQSALTRLRPDGSAETTGPLMKSVLPVDVAPSTDGTVILVAAGAGGLSDVAAGFVHPGDWARPTECTMLSGLSWSGLTGTEGGGRAVAAAWTEAGLVVQLQAPMALVLAPQGGVVDRLVLEGGPPHRGVELMNLAPTGSVACASCHPEGGEDGRTWRFERGDLEQPRRTQSLAGGVPLHTAPLHWDAEHATLGALLVDTLARRIGGELRDGDEDALARALEQVPAPVRRGEEAGEAVFLRAGCDSCHGGPWLTDGLTHDVGTRDPGGPVAMQTPSLRGLGARGPWMHDGCAVTLEDRFDPACGGSDHGVVAAEDVAALVGWLRGL